MWRSVLVAQTLVQPTSFSPPILIDNILQIDDVAYKVVAGILRSAIWDLVEFYNNVYCLLIIII